MIRIAAPFAERGADVPDAQIAHEEDGATVVRHGRALGLLRGRQVLILSRRDVRHPAAGGAETYVHRIAARWAGAGVGVTMLTARVAGAPTVETIDGVLIRRAGGDLSVYSHSAGRLWSWGDHFDVILDCQSGMPFFAPFALGPRVPVVQLVDRIRHDPPGQGFPAAVAAVGRLLEGPVARRVYGRTRSVAVSPSTRQEMREHLGVEGPIDVVPGGGPPVVRTAARRASDPTVVVVGRLVASKRIELLVDAVAAVRHRIPGLQVDVVGSGPALATLRAAAAQRGLGASLTFHGRVGDATRDMLLARAWLTTSTSSGNGWGCTVLEAAAAGVPTVALREPGIRDAVLDGRTGWLIDGPDRFAGALLDAVQDVSDPCRAAEMAQACRAWASCFTWDRSAELLAGTVVAAMQQVRHVAAGRADTRLRLRSDCTTAAWFDHPDPAAVAGRLRVTDEMWSVGSSCAAVLRECDDVAALARLEELGAVDVRVRPATRYQLLGGPALLDPRLAPDLLRSGSMT